MIETPHGAIDYDESGIGPTLVLVPGSCSTGAVWRPIIACWANRFRCVTTSVLGYGGTAERRTTEDTDIAHEAEALEAVIRHAGGAVHLIGHSFGGLIALAVALRARVPLRSLGIIEAPALGLLRAPEESRHHRAFADMTEAYFAAFRAGDRTAIEVMIDFYGGPGTFAGWPDRVRDHAIRNVPTNLLDWQTAAGLPLSPAILAQVAVPTLVICGGESHPAVLRANQLLAQGIAQASLASLAEAAHFMISTHPEHVAGMLARHVAGAEPEALAPSADEQTAVARA